MHSTLYRLSCPTHQHYAYGECHSYTAIEDLVPNVWTSKKKSSLVGNEPQEQFCLFVLELGSLLFIISSN